MIFTDPNEPSAGKVLEIQPVITDHFGQPFGLPPVRYVLPNALLGYEPHQPVSIAIQLPPSGRVLIGPGGRYPSEITFWCRILEHLPDQDPQPAPFDLDAVQAFMHALASKSIDGKETRGGA
jgi:hypothetical protein